MRLKLRKCSVARVIDEVRRSPGAASGSSVAYADTSGERADLRGSGCLKRRHDIGRLPRAAFPEMRADGAKGAWASAGSQISQVRAVPYEELARAENNDVFGQALRAQRDGGK
jgi:hypothetical protein